MDWLSHVEQAIEALAYVKPEYARQLAELMEARSGEHPRSIALAFRKIGTQLTGDEKRAMGLRANAFLTREALDSLTDKGHTCVLEAHSVTLLRAALSCYRTRGLEAARTIGTSQLRVSGAFMDCPGCQRFSGKCIIDIDAFGSIPPADCNREACAVIVDPHIDFLKGIR